MIRTVFDARGDGTAHIIGAGLAPYPVAGTNHCRYGRVQGNPISAFGSGVAVSAKYYDGQGKSNRNVFLPT